MKWGRERKRIPAKGNNVNGEAAHAYLSHRRRRPCPARMRFPEPGLALDTLGMNQPKANKKKALRMG